MNMTPRQFHWCVKRHRIDDTDTLERALNMYDSLGWQIFDVDISGGMALVVMRAPRDQKRPPETVSKQLPNGLKELPDKPLGRGKTTPPAVALPTHTTGLSVPDLIEE